MTQSEYQRRRSRVRDAIDRWADGSLPRDLEPALFGELWILVRSGGGA